MIMKIKKIIREILIQLLRKNFKTHLIEDGDDGMECDIHFTRK